MTGTRGGLRFKVDCPACGGRKKITIDAWFPQPGNPGWWRASTCFKCGLKAVAGPLTGTRRRERWTPR